jgi:Ca-activated chloride channel family protein
MMGAFKIPTGENIDEGLLQAIAEKTGGFYGRADDADALVNIVKKINELEKTTVKSVQYAQYSEQFGPWALAALVALAAEMLAGCTVFRKIP